MNEKEKDVTLEERNILTIIGLGFIELPNGYYFRDNCYYDFSAADISRIQYTYSKFEIITQTEILLDCIVKHTLMDFNL